jgi:hypothetical protein
MSNQQSLKKTGEELKRAKFESKKSEKNEEQKSSSGTFTLYDKKTTDKL